MSLLGLDVQMALVWLDLAVAHGKASHCLVHLSLICCSVVVDSGVTGAARSIHGLVAALLPVFLLLTYFRYCRVVKVLPERLHACHILVIVQLSVLTLLIIHLMVDVRRKFLLVQIVDDFSQV